MSMISRWRRTMMVGAIGAASCALLLAGTAAATAAPSHVVVAQIAAQDLVSVELTPRILAGSVFLSISATNNSSAPVDIAISTVYGGQTFTAVAPGRTVATSVNTRLATIPSGVATITATSGTTTETTTVPYGGYPIEVVPRTLAGRVHLSVTATNPLAVPADVVVTTAYGGKTFRGVAPGASVSVSVNSRLAAVPAGEATMTATAVAGGNSITRTAPYPAYPGQ
ncbi:hypothetical protein [Microbacterium sp. NPDC055357]